MRFPIQFNLSLIKAGLSADERRAIRDSISSNIQNYQTVQERLKRYDVSLPNVFQHKTDTSSIYRVNYELQFYNQHRYTKFESQQYSAMIDDLITIGVHGVEPETLNSVSDNEWDWSTLQHNLGQALFYNELHQETGDTKFLDIVNGCRGNIIDILSKYV